MKGENAAFINNVGNRTLSVTKSHQRAASPREIQFIRPQYNLQDAYYEGVRDRVTTGIRAACRGRVNYAKVKKKVLRNARADVYKLSRAARPSSVCPAPHPYM
ncbi:hypothetical protein EVAR_14712_1 [Eumeta japonica]|uniref:Uncharacterized protein n=1 Tax=Eumeta variegata TaxID=151549 RepID=A0A4C1U265_EUMVA|nr:hypothetical protein EVAR_14712_1 [Eumeta japonica]